MADRHEHEKGVQPNDRRAEPEDERDEAGRGEPRQPSPRPGKTPRFGSAGSGGLEYEPGPEKD